MRTLQAVNPYRMGAMGIIVAAVVTGVGQSFTSIPMVFAQATYYGEFKDTGGLNKGDKVRIAGVNVGEVQGFTINGNHVVMKFSIGSNTIGSKSRLAIRTDTILGKKVLEIDPQGSRVLQPNETLPLGQNTSPYQIYDAFFDVTKAATGWDINTVKRSLNVLSQTVEQTYPHLSAALDGVAKFSDTLGKRDEQIQQLLADARKVASILGDRSKQIDRILANTQIVLAAFNERKSAIDGLLGNIAAVSAQLKGLIDDNPNLHNVVEQLRTISDLLLKHKKDLVEWAPNVSYYASALAESVASGPYFKVALLNLAPFWMTQPWVDAAFKKRGIDPEQFWRSAGLPAYQFPDPNGTRFPNGAPPPAPPVREGTPDRPGPAVPPGASCAYTPAEDGLPRPWNPLPCMGLGAGPFGGPSTIAPFDVQTSPPDPNGLPPTPGIPIAGRPDEPPPNVPGTPVPLPAKAPPGARTENLAPAGPTSPPSTFAPGLPPGPPFPSGPGPQLPGPFITPGGTGGSGAATGGSQN